MILAVIGMLVCLVIACYEYQKAKQREKELLYVTEKLKEILSEDTAQQIKVVTADTALSGLVAQINELLEKNARNYVEYHETKDSTRKMLSNISHDLKTPLTVVLGYLEMLTLRSENVKEVSRIYQKVQEVMELINRFFDLAKLEAGDKDYPLSKVNISEITRQSILGFSAMLEKTKAKIEIKIPEQEYFVIGNEEALLRIFNNIINNAIKYGMDGKYLAVRVIPKTEHVTVEITDHGKGIPKQYQKRIFERLYTLEDSRSSKYQGNGLGLTITEQLVEKLDGSITLTSTPYEQTTFALQFLRAN